MGEEGRFSRDDLRYLMLNVTYGISALDVTSYATVLIGAGAGNLPMEHALRGLLFGVCDALQRLPASQRLRRLIVVETNADRHREIGEKLDQFKEQEPASQLDIRITSSVLPDAGRRRRATARTATASAPAAFGPRITIEREGDVFRFSALTTQAVVPVREVEIQSFFPEGISERLMQATGKREQERLGRLLTTTLVPESLMSTSTTRTR